MIGKVDLQNENSSKLLFLNKQITLKHSICKIVLYKYNVINIRYQIGTITKI